MFQKFFTDTLMSRFIKSLLAQTPVFCYDSVRAGDFLIENQYYIFKSVIIKCVKTGRLYIDEGQEIEVSSSPTPRSNGSLLSKTDTQSAEFIVVAHADESNKQLAHPFISNTSYYDSDTHIALGQYLRHLRAAKGLNLMPYYNCYSGLILSDTQLSQADNNSVLLARVSNVSQKVVAVPIKVGKTYTIAIDCPTPVLLRASVHDSNRYIEEAQLPAGLLSDLSNSGKMYSRLRFDQPITYTFNSTDINSSYLSRDLYLLIQLPLNNTSSIVILEDVSLDTRVACDENGVLLHNNIKPALLDKNFHEIFAFSDRLIEYLLGNVIHPEDPINENIAKIQTALSNKYPAYRADFIRGTKRKGIFDADLSRYVHQLVDDGPDYYKYDQDGNINRDIEILLKLNGGDY